MTTQGKLHYQYERLIGIKMDIRNINKRAFTEEEKTIFAHLKKAYEERVMGIGKTFEEAFSAKIVSGAIDTEKINAILNSSWSSDELNLSKRIWKRGEQVSQAVMDELTRCTVLGLPPEAGVKRLERMVNKECKNASAHAATLLRTESARIASIAEKDAYDALGVEKYVISATLDEKTSEICQEMDGKVFDVKDMEPGINAPPFHPNCRSTTCPYFEDYETPTRAARDPVTGKTYTEENIPYKEWKKRWEEKFSPVQEHEKSGKHSKETRQDEDKKGIIKPEEIKRLNDIGFATVDPSWANIAEETRVILEDQLEKLEEMYGAFHQGDNTIECEPLLTARGVVKYRPVTPCNKTLCINPVCFLNLDRLMSDFEYEISMRHKMPLRNPERDILLYTVTHEYGHAIIDNMLEAYLKPFFDQGKINNRAEFEAYKNAFHERIKEEILTIAKEIDPNFQAEEEVSKYGMKEIEEFFAEVFVGLQLGHSNTIAKAVKRWLKKKGVTRHD